MIDLERGLLWFSLSDPDFFSKVIQNGLGSECLDNAGLKKGMLFAGRHFQEYGKMPGVSEVSEISGVEIATVDLDKDFILKELMNRELFRQLRNGMTEVESILKGNDPHGALALIRQMAEDPKNVVGFEPTNVWDLHGDVMEMYDMVKNGKRGVSFPWDSMTNWTRGMWPGTVTIIVARPSVGKCVRWDTPTIDPETGIYSSVKEVVRRKSHVFTRFRDGSIRKATPSAWLPMGVKRCIRVVLRSGKELSGTSEHPVMTVDGWKRLDSISVGESVETVRMIPEPTNTVRVPESEVYILAGMLAEGCYTSGCTKFSNTDPEIIKLMSDNISTIGAEMWQPPSSTHCDYNIRWPSKDKREFNVVNPVRLLLNKYGCGHEKSNDKVIPSKVFSYSNKMLAKFLGMFWSCDGHVGSRGDVDIGLASEVMVRQIQRLMLRFGITGRVRARTSKLNGKVFKSWTYRIHSTCVVRFRDTIPLVGIKKIRQLRLSEPKHPNVDNIPMTDLLVELINDVSGSGVECRRKMALVAERLGWSCGISKSKFTRRGSVSRRLLSIFADVFESDEIRALTVNHWDQVVSVCDDGEHEVCDLTVPGTHSFVANDIVVHNTFLACMAAHKAWSEEENILVISPEMSKVEFAERMLSIESGVSYKDFVAGELGVIQEGFLKDRINTLSGDSTRPIWILDADDDISLRGIESAVRQLKPTFLVIDSLYDLHIKGKDKTERLEKAMTWCRKGAKKMKVPILGFSQLNRTAEKSHKKGGGTRMGTVALTDQLAWDAYNLFALEQDKDMKQDRILRIVKIKIRRGFSPKPYIDVAWDFDLMKFGEIIREKAVFTDVDDDDDFKGF